MKFIPKKLVAAAVATAAMTGTAAQAETPVAFKNCAEAQASLSKFVGKGFGSFTLVAQDGQTCNVSAGNEAAAKKASTGTKTPERLDFTDCAKAQKGFEQLAAGGKASLTVKSCTLKK